MKKLLVCIALVAILPACKDKKFNLFTIQDDKQLGLQLAQEISNNPQEYPILPESQYPQAYQYLRSLRDSILNTGTVRYKNEFDWEIYIIRDDQTLNAFCAPGGYIYFYTGILKFLDTEDELAGVMGHEMAHADRRHSTSQLSKNYGISALLGIALGNDPGLLAQVAAGLISLRFSRGDETEADEYSVRYLCATSYNAAGAAGFFSKLENLGGGAPPQFLSTHPSPENRVAKIQQNKIDFQCNGNEMFVSRYQQFKNSLP